MLARTALTIALLSACVPTAYAADPVGFYKVEGKGPDSNEIYKGTVAVTKTGETYKIVWQIGNDTYIGTGIGNTKFMAISYKSGDSTGIALYGEEGNNWVGPWTYADGTSLGAERWIRQ